MTDDKINEIIKMRVTSAHHLEDLVRTAVNEALEIQRQEHEKELISRIKKLSTCDFSCPYCGTKLYLIGDPQ